MSDLAQLLEVDDIAVATGLHPQTVYEYVRGGELRALKLGNRWKIKPEDYDAWLESKRATPRTPRQRPVRASRTRAARPRSGGAGSLARLAEIEAEGR